MTTLHERQAIRAAIIAQLTSKTGAATRVYASRKPPLPENGLPAINVYTDSEISDDENTGTETAPRELLRTVHVVIEAYVAAPDACDDNMDAIALEIETAMDGDDSLNGTAYKSWPTAMQMEIDYGDQQMGCIQLTYVVQYHTDLRTADVDTARPAFTLADVKTSLGGAQAPADQTEDQVQIPQ